MDTSDRPLSGAGALSSRSGGERSFVLRSGRMTDHQKDALGRLYPVYGAPYAPGSRLDPDALFPGVAGPFVVEIGFGMGAATALIARELPDTRFLGIEVHAPGVGKLLAEIEARGLENLRVMRHDAQEVIRDMLPEGSVDGFHVFFPDPWPKKRHHKRRIMGAEFIRLLATRLKKGGYLYFVTDWEEYAEWTLERLTAEPLLSNAHDRWATRAPWRPETKFERRALEEKRPIRELRFTRR